AELTHRLNAARQRTRRLIAVERLAQLVLGAVAVLMALVGLDWWVHLPVFLRAAATVAAVWIAGAWVLKRIVLPWRRHIPLQEVAMRIDRMHSQLGDRLATAIESRLFSSESDELAAESRPVWPD